MEERLRFVARLLEGEAMTEVCREFGISRKTGYKIFDRYKEHGLEALTDRSRRPVRYANQLPPQIESLIVAPQARQAALGRAQDPRAAGPPAGRRCARAGQEHHPCRLDRHGLVKAHAAGHATAPPARPCHRGPHPTSSGAPTSRASSSSATAATAIPLTVTDHASRYLLLCEALESTREDTAHHRLRAAVPRARPAAGHPLRQRRALRQPQRLFNLSKLSVWWLRLGIAIERIKPGHPQQNGRHERMHLTLRRKPPGRPA